jgi:hypothetical protein
MNKFEFNGNWQTEIELLDFRKFNNIEFYSKKSQEKASIGQFSISIEDALNENPDIEIEQLNAIHFLQNNQKALISFFFNYFKDIIYPYSQEDLSFEDYPECYPALNTEDDLFELLGLNEIIIKTLHKDSCAYIMYGFTTMIDIEHGCNITMHKLTPIEHNATYNYEDEKICEDLGLDYSKYKTTKYEKDEQIRLSEGVLYQPNPKFNKLKPWQEEDNIEELFKLMRNNEFQQFKNLCNQNLNLIANYKIRLRDYSKYHKMQDYFDFLISI